MKYSYAPALLFVFTLLWAFAAGADTVYVNVGDNFDSLIQVSPEGTVFFINAGTYRGISNIGLKRDQQVIGELGSGGERLAIFSGAMELTDWVQEDNYWVHDVPFAESGNCGGMLSRGG